MKSTFVSLVTVIALAMSARASDVTSKVSDVHLCCQSCVKGVQADISKVPGATASVDKDEGTVTLNGPDKATVQKAADALTSAGYFGKSSNPDIKISAKTGATGKQVQSLKMEGVHLCCGKCVKAVDEAVRSVSGVKDHTAVKNAESFEVTGDFNDMDVVTALQKAGLTGKAVK
jgi:copper chaperone CopZ